ncbi:TIGR04222 domain-containing membrane protein [Streptomyces sp. NPDC051098]|uniref:TIGR04222 domain-containing membrane protein n=1 Tax=Streptomyces sp. NPDC051098 TaxID=3155411 RepID=UPI00341C5E7C
MRTLFRRPPATTAPQTLDVYDIAHLAGGPRRVVEVALVTLSERGAVTLRATRVRAVDQQARGHRVERALLALCPRGRSTAAVFAALRAAPEVEEIGSRLVAYGLVARSGRRPTATGRRSLEKARQEGVLPHYVFEGPAALPDRRVRQAVGEASTVPSGLGKRLVRMAKAVDDSGPDADHGTGGGGHAGGHHSCGGGGGGSD